MPDYLPRICKCKAARTFVLVTPWDVSSCCGIAKAAALTGSDELRGIAEHVSVTVSLQVDQHVLQQGPGRVSATHDAGAPRR
jgi:hypothetical protein